MHEPDIAPLARRLAEENNVDWRRLRGTGEGGRVVERDVLGFLARVMAGDEAVDPTPEPVPEGMEAWPEEDVAAYRARASGEPEPASPPTVDDELFLFEEPALAAPTVDEESEAEGEGLGVDLGGVGDDPWLEDDLRLAPSGDEAAGDRGEDREEEVADAAPDTPPSTATDDVVVSGDADAESVPPPAAANEGAEPFPPPPAAADDDDDDALLLVGDDEAEDEEVAVLDAVVEEPGASDDVRIDELPDLTAPDAPPLEAEDARVHPPGARDGFELPDLFSSDEIEVPEAPSLDALFEAGTAVDGESTAWEAVDAAPEAGEMTLEATVDAGEAERFEAVGAIVPDEPEEPVPDAGATPVAAEPESPRETAVMAEPTEPDEAAAPLAFAPDVGLVSHGQVWRRRLDDSALRRAVSDVAAVLDAAPANVTLVLLARAAHRSGVAGGPLKVWRWQRGGAELRAVDASADVRVAVRSLESPSGSGEEVPASLVVADLSALDVDEAVLHLGRPVLALGRAGRNGAWLTLSGDEVEPGSVDALVRIADLLSAPARLLV